METLDSEGIARVRNRFTVASPVTGKLCRIQLEEGDSVRKGLTVACIEPPPLNTREYEETNARMKSVQATMQAAEAEMKRVEVSREQAELKYKRFKQLYQDGAIASEAFENAEDNLEVIKKDYQAATLRAEAARYDYVAAKSAIDHAISGSPVNVGSPVAGKVLRIFEKNERVVSAGTPLIELGNPADIEAVIDVLSSDAVKVKKGNPVLLEEWGGDRALKAIVRTIEPAAFTKISALGIEEKRVNIIADFQGGQTALGDNYRVQAKIVLWEGKDVLKVPVSSLFRGEDGWNVFVIGNGTAKRRTVKIGHRGAYEAEVLDGLKEGAQVVVHPPNELEEGKSVEVRK
ncbi:MAG: efflux RND transporter periplasmic adaptor subunit, partial [Chlorobiales bacterium]|nr:efflux RND transporter periplasmic adaptor subunit [Chlorobiales bacterium]